MDKKILKYTPKDVEFNNLSFLARPLRLHEKGDLRFHINHIRVEEDRSAVSTNGSILCLVNRVPLIKGYYLPLKVHKTALVIQYVGGLDQFDYPQYKDIVTSAASVNSAKLVHFKVDREDYYGLAGAHAKIIRAMNENTIDVKLLGVLTDGDWVGHVRDEEPSYFSQNERIALIMSLSVK
jgi:hypothetical protein